MRIVRRRKVESTVQVLAADNQLVVIVLTVLLDPSSKLEDVLAQNLGQRVGKLENLPDATGWIRVRQKVERVDIAIWSAKVNGGSFSSYIFACISENIGVVDANGGPI